MRGDPTASDVRRARRFPTGQAPARRGMMFDRDGHARIPFDIVNSHVWLRGRVNAPILFGSCWTPAIRDVVMTRWPEPSLRSVGEPEALGGCIQRGPRSRTSRFELAGLSLAAGHGCPRPPALGAMPGGRPCGHSGLSCPVVRRALAYWRVREVWDAVVRRGICRVGLPITCRRISHMSRECRGRDAATGDGS